MRFFEHILSSAGRALDEACERMASSRSSGAISLAIANAANRVREWTDTLDVALARRGVRLQSLLVAKIAAVLAGSAALTLLGVHTLHAMRPPAPPPLQSAEAEVQAQLSGQILADKASIRAAERAARQRPARRLPEAPSHFAGSSFPIGR